MRFFVFSLALAIAVTSVSISSAQSQTALPLLENGETSPASEEALRVAFAAAQTAFWQAESPQRGAALTNPQSLRVADLKTYIVAAKRADEFLKLFPPPGARRIEIADVVPDGRINERPKQQPRPATPAITDTRVPTALYSISGFNTPPLAACFRSPLVTDYV